MDLQYHPDLRSLGRRGTLREIWVEICCRQDLQTMALFEAKILLGATLFRTRDLILLP